MVCTVAGKMWNKVGWVVTPKPTPIETAITNRLFTVMSTAASILIPWAPTMPNITSIAPPRTDVGINVAIALNFGINPKINNIPAEK